MPLTVFETPRLYGHDVAPGDAGFLTRLFSDPANGVSFQGITRDDVCKTIQSQLRAREASRRNYWWIVLRDDRARAVGLGTLMPSAEMRGAGDVGVIIGTPFREIGYGSEAVTGLARLSFNVAAFRRAKCVTATINPANVPSQRMLASIGFVPTRLARADYWNGRQFEDSQHYTLARTAPRLDL